MNKLKKVIVHYSIHSLSSLLSAQASLGSLDGDAGAGEPRRRVGDARDDAVTTVPGGEADDVEAASQRSGDSGRRGGDRRPESARRARWNVDVRACRVADCIQTDQKAAVRYTHQLLGLAF